MQSPTGHYKVPPTGSNVSICNEKEIGSDMTPNKIYALLSDKKYWKMMWVQNIYVQEQNCC